MLHSFPRYGCIIVHSLLSSTEGHLGCLPNAEVNILAHATLSPQESTSLRDTMATLIHCVPDS